jgi:hypothetical protein
VGILDEAIRDHLELKRQHGANREELQRLEDEAFGPPSRPGEPDFPQAATSTAEAPEAEVPAAAEELPTTIVGADENHGEAQPAARPEPEPAAEPAPESSAEPAPPVVEPEADEHPVLDEGAASPATPYDHTAEDDLDLGELDLELEEPLDTVAPPAAPPPTETPAPAESAPPTEEHAPEPPIESLETVEHPFEPGLTDEELESEEVAEEPSSEELDHAPAGDEPPPDEPAASHEGEGESGDDVLADTPEFLRDAPEDDELWFEQGEPKDFDFD